MHLALISGQPYLDVIQWEPEAVATAIDYYEERAADARREAERNR